MAQHGTLPSYGAQPNKQHRLRVSKLQKIIQQSNSNKLYYAGIVSYLFYLKHSFENKNVDEYQSGIPKLTPFSFLC